MSTKYMFLISADVGTFLFVSAFSYPLAVVVIHSLHFLLVLLLLLLHLIVVIGLLKFGGLVLTSAVLLASDDQGQTRRNSRSQKESHVDSSEGK